MHLLQAVIENVDELPVALLHRDADALAKKFGVEIRTAAEFAASVARHPIQPEGEPDAVSEDKIDLPRLQRHLGVVRAVERHGLGARKELLEIGLVTGPFRHPDLLASDGLGAHVPELAV